MCQGANWPWSYWLISCWQQIGGQIYFTSCIRSRQPGLDLGAFQSRQPGPET